MSRSQIGRTWKVGKFGKPGDPTRNTGVIILVEPKETGVDGTRAVLHRRRLRRRRVHHRRDVGADVPRCDRLRSRRATTAADRADHVQVAQRFADEYHFSSTRTLVAARAGGARARAARRTLPPFAFVSSL